jgi:4-amino-4-deoxy-L-arabinose transferase-like glycosyltransferase
MPVAFFITLCLLSFYSFVISESRGRQIFYAMVFWISFGIGNLAKGPAPLPLVLLPLFFYIAFNRKWSVLPKMMPVLGIIIFLAILLPWPLIVAYKVNWNLVIWKKEFLDRLVGEYAPGRYPFYYYFIMMFKYITPWVVFLPVAMAAPFFKGWAEKRAVMKYLWFWFVVDFIFLTIDVGKRQHYILPLMPAMAILVGILLEDMVFSRKVYPPVFIRRFAIVNVSLVTIAVVGGIGAAAIFWPAKLAGVTILCLFAAGATILMSLLFYKRKLVAALAVCFVSVSISFMVYVWYDATVVEDFRPVRDFASQIAEKVPKGAKLVSYGGVSSTFVYYYGTVVQPIPDSESLYQCYKQGDWIVATSADVVGLLEDGHFGMVYYKAYQPKLRKHAVGGLFHKSE